MIAQKQNKFSFAYTPSVSQLGKKIDEKKVLLHGWILTDSLGAKQYYPNYENPGEPVTDVICPFCTLGRLVLRRVERIVTGPKIHIGNCYQYGCTDCLAEFLGEIRWSSQ